jgi:hypothetical protein
LKRELASRHNDAPGTEDVQVDPDALPNVEPAFDQCNEIADEMFDPGSLPPIESITAETDISGFLRSRVPAELTRAALRRTWASDPAIRDFIGIAENQWDFNDPNSIPGFGVLNGTDIVPVLLQQALGEYEKLAGSTPASVRQAPSDAVRPIATELEQPDIPNASSEADSEDTATVTESDLAAQQDDSPTPRRSHGGALPR